MKIAVTLQLQACIEFAHEDEYSETLFHMIQHLEEHGFSVNIVSEEKVDSADS